MAVCTPDDALLDFGKDAFPRNGVSHKIGHVHRLIANVVEIQYTNVTFAAVYTRMLYQIRNDIAAIPFPITLVISAPSLAERRNILMIGRLIELPLTRFAV